MATAREDQAVAGTGAAVITCRHCGGQFPTRTKPGNTARCTGCGYAQRVPAPARPGRADQATGPAQGWDPPGGPRAAYRSTDQCPRCSALLLATPRGTVRACSGPACPGLAAPPGVLAPYRRGQDVTRTVTSQRERDLAAIELARRKGLMLAQLAALAGDPRLDPASVPVIDWFREQVKDASGGTRLGELAALLPEADIRRRKWWQGRPAAIQAPAPRYAGEDDDDGQDYEDQDDEDDEDQDEDEVPPAALATPASIAAQQHRAQPQPMTWARAITACGWRLSPVTGGCQIIEHAGLCGAALGGSITGGWVCAGHYAGLCAVITEHNRRAGL